MKAPLLFYVRHGETEWNRQDRLQGQHHSELTALGRAQAVHCGEILCQLLARDGRDAGALDFVSNPLGRAPATMEVMRAALGLEPVDYRTHARLAELAFGRWVLLARHKRIALVRQQLGIDDALRNFVPPGGESYTDFAGARARLDATLRRDSVVVAHRATARALVALRCIAEREKAAAFAIDQGVINVFAGGGVARYA
jgi:broad specificity phosphatase PhoE